MMFLGMFILKKKKVIFKNIIIFYVMKFVGGSLATVVRSIYQRYIRLDYRSVDFSAGLYLMDRTLLLKSSRLR
jgi:hypothetical protein